jgi:class 3 adenylate cyclase
VEVNRRSLAIFPIVLTQKVVGLSLIAASVGLIILFGLQFPHSPKMDALWVIERLHLYGDPLLSQLAPYLNSHWPQQTISFVPLIVALAVWAVKLTLNLGFQRARRAVAKMMPLKGKQAAPITGLLGEEEAVLGADTEQARDQLLKRYREIEGMLKAAKRKQCTFLSIDVVGSTGMKVGERPTNIAATFQAYEEMLKKIFKQYGAWKEAWTPDGVMICFLQVDLAVAAGIRILTRLDRFNEHDNKLRTPFQVRCGINEGGVQIFEDSKLEKVADRVIDVAGHMQKQSNINTLWMGAEVYNHLADKSGFKPIGKEVDGYKVYEWAVEQTEAAAPATAPASAPATQQ